MTRQTTQFARRGPAHILSGRHPLGQWARASFAIPIIAFMLLGAWLEPTRATFCTITQITSTTASVNGSPSISGDGTRVVFRSSADLTGANADRNPEILLCDIASAAFTQVTNTTRGFTFGGSINGDGSRLALDFSADLTGGNPDFSAEIFLYDANTANLTQVTNSPSDFSRSPSISADGTRIAFRSFANLTGGNADRNAEIFLYDPATADLTQITNVTAGSSDSPSIGADGSRIAFLSTANLTGSNADGNAEIFLYDMASAGFTQITNSTAGFNQLPSISADGGRIAFQATANLTGGNADGNVEIFLYDEATANLTQITNATTGFSQFPSISGDGTRVAFSSTADLTGGNADGSEEIFLYDTATPNLTQITDSAAGNSSAPSVSADGGHIAFQSTANLTGGNADGSEEIFLATCPLPPSERAADLLVSMSAGPDPVKTGENLTYTIRVKNLGPGPAFNLAINDPLPLGTTFVSASSSHGSLTAPPVGTAGTVTCDAARLGSLDTLTVTLVVNVTARGKTTITNEASAGADTPDPNSNNNSAAVQTRIFGSRR
jgi:uncharacterized repeat protein (TIGR01451 family)